MTALRLVQKFIASFPRRPAHFVKLKTASKGSSTKMQALVLLIAVVALFCVVYVITLWLEPN